MTNPSYDWREMAGLGPEGRARRGGAASGELRAPQEG